MVNVVYQNVVYQSEAYQNVVNQRDNHSFDLRSNGP